MAALAAPRMTNHLGEGAVIQLLRVPLAASTKIWAGSLVMIDGGYLKPAAAATGKKVVGRARATFDNSAGSAGAVTGEVERGTFGWAIGTSGDALTQADVGATVYAIDDQTVGKTDGSGARSAAGTLWQLEDGLAYVESY